MIGSRAREFPHRPAYLEKTANQAAACELIIARQSHYACLAANRSHAVDNLEAHQSVLNHRATSSIVMLAAVEFSGRPA